MKATSFLLLSILFVFFLQIIYPEIEKYFSLIPAITIFEPWRIITAMFLHANFFHLFLNSYALFIFGSELERRVGSRKFLEIYFASGIFASVFYTVIAYFVDPFTPAVGASGAIYGIIGALALIAPTLTILVYFVPIPLLLFAVIYAFMEFLGTISFILGGKSSIAYAAHFGGIIIGFLYGKTIKNSLRKTYLDFFA
ncbi:MAG: rhomboid family intramembrane serine protease [Candidatus Aenigmatarchaeota archaeon]